jgi:hypothetical protein
LVFVILTFFKEGIGNNLTMPSGSWVLVLDAVYSPFLNPQTVSRKLYFLFLKKRGIVGTLGATVTGKDAAGQLVLFEIKVALEAKLVVEPVRG